VRVARQEQRREPRLAKISSAEIGRSKLAELNQHGLRRQLSSQIVEVGLRCDSGGYPAGWHCARRQ
jgi:hypothetical protein